MNKRNLLKTCLQITYPVDFCIIYEHFFTTGKYIYIKKQQKNKKNKKKKNKTKKTKQKNNNKKTTTKKTNKTKTKKNKQTFDCFRKQWL